MLFQNVPCIYKLSKMVIASVNMHGSQGNSRKCILKTMNMLIVFLCVYLWLPKIHVVLTSYAQMSSFGKEVKAAVLCSDSFIQ